MALAQITQPAQPASDPLLVYLHGAGEIGGDPDSRVRRYGPWSEVLYDPRHAYGPDTRAEIARFHVLGLHLPEGDWDPAELDNTIEAYFAAHPELDRTRLHLTGLSRGGRGVLTLALHRRQHGRPVTTVAAFCPAVRADTFSDADVTLLRQVPIYIFHAPEDEVVPFDASAALHRRIGTRTSRLRIVHQSELADPNGARDCWTQFYAEPDLYRWMLNHAPDPACWPHLSGQRGRPVAG